MREEFLRYLRQKTLMPASQIDECLQCWDNPDLLFRLQHPAKGRYLLFLGRFIKHFREKNA